MRLPLLRRKPQLHLRPESIPFPKVTLGIKRQTPQHLLSFWQLALDFCYQFVHVGGRIPGGDPAVAVGCCGPVGGCGLGGEDEFQFDGDGGAWFAGYCVEDVAGYEGAVGHGWRGGFVEGCRYWWSCWLEVGCDLCESVGRGLCAGGHRLREDLGEGTREREDQSIPYLGNIRCGTGVLCLGGGSIVGRVGDGRIVTMFLKRRVADKINCFDLTATITSHDSMYICTQFHLQLSSTKGEVRSDRSAYLLSRYKSYRNNIDQNEQSTYTRRAIARRGCIFMTGIRTICIKIICLPKPTRSYRHFVCSTCVNESRVPH